MVASRGRTRMRLIQRVVPLLVVGVLLGGPLSHAAAQDSPSESFAGQEIFVPRSTQDYIAQGLETGAISYPESLEYRAFAMFKDSRLPAEFVGEGPEPEDASFFLEVNYFWNELPEATRLTLTPFVARPTDSRSLFHTVAADGATTAPAADPSDPPVYADGDCTNNWASKDGPNYPYKVWMHCTDDYEDDLDAAIEIIDFFWQKEVELMGEPLLDSGSRSQGGDERIDFYFVEGEGDSAPRAGGAGIDESTAAYAAGEGPFVGKGSTAFVVARRPTIGEPRLELTMAHEFFHVLQYAHNWEIGFGFKGTKYSDDFDILTFAEMWFVEATADWMKSWIYRDVYSPEVMLEAFHYRFIQFFQGVDLPLTYSTRQGGPGFSHIYASSIYFLFLEQEIGAEAVAQFWDELAPFEPDDFHGTTVLLDEIYPFREHFRDFAVRNLNLDLPGDPIDPSYIDIDPTFPEGIKPPMNIGDGSERNLEALAEDEAPYEFGDAIPNLTAHYYFFVPRPEVAALTLDFSSLTPNDALDVDMIVKIEDGVWERRQLPTDEPVTFCFNNPEDDLDRFYLVLSNHDINEDTIIRGATTIATTSEEC